MGATFFCSALSYFSSMRQLILLFSVLLLEQRNFAEEADWQYGTEVRFIDRAMIPGIRTIWLSNAKDLDGTYDGIGKHSGDRRFGFFERQYRIRIRTTDSSQKVSPVDVEWWSKTENWGSNDGSTADLAKFSVRDAKSNGSQIWGTMFASVAGKDQGPQFPFLAMPAEKEDGTKGILLFGRYEGPVFLKKK